MTIFPIGALGLTLTLASSYATAQTAASPSGNDQLAEVIVTAQRRSENMQKVPVTVSSVDANQLAASHILDAQDLPKLIPALQLPSYAGTVLTFLRGVGSPIAAIGNEASVAIYVDGVYYSRLPSILFRLNNVDHVEVDKGPQGTLFGRNASGGLIQIITKQPTPGQDLTLDAQVGYGNYGTTDESVYLADGINDKVAFDVAAISHIQSDGWGTYVDTGAQHYTDNSQAIRSKMIIELPDDTRLKLTGEYGHYDSDMGIPTHFLGHPQGSYSGYFGSPVVIPQIGAYDADGTFPDNYRGMIATGVVRLEHDFSFGTLTNTASYQRQTENYHADQDYQPPDYLGVILPSTGTQLIDELLLQSKSDDRFDWSAGLFYLDERQEYDPAALPGSLIGASLGTPYGYEYIYSHTAVKDISVFAQGRYEIAPDLKLTLGARESHDKINGNGEEQLQAASGPGALLGTAFTVPGTVGSGEKTYDEFSFKTGLDYQFTSDVMGYLSVSRGFKGATFGTIPFMSTPAEPEVLTAYEVGLKTDLFERRLRLNGAAFWYQIKDPQVVTVPAPGFTVDSNAKSARSRGLELEAIFAATSNLRLDAAVSYLNAKYTSYANAPFNFPDPNPPYGNYPTTTNPPNGATGNNMIYAPRWSGSIGPQYSFNLANGGVVNMNLNASFTSVFYFEPDNRVSQPGYGLLDAAIGYVFPGNKVTVRFWGSNLTNKFYYTSETSQGSVGGDVGNPGAPRTYGVTAEVKY